MRMVLLGWLVWVIGIMKIVEGEIIGSVMNDISRLNKEGPYLGIVVPNSFEMNPLLQSPSFVVNENFPFLDFSGRRFRIGTLESEKVIIVMTGLSMLNAGIATELLLTLFKVKGVLHFGIAGNANPQLQIGDVTIPQFWAHTGLWNWQGMNLYVGSRDLKLLFDQDLSGLNMHRSRLRVRYGQGPDDELAFESSGYFTRRIGYLNFSNYSPLQKGKSSDNLLNSVWYQPEEILPIDGYPEIRQHAFWVPVNKQYFSLAKKLEDMKLDRCVNFTCLPKRPQVVRVKRGISANVFVDNGAYRKFLHSKFNATPIDMESAAVALICLQKKKPFIAIRALSDLAGGGSSLSNEAEIFGSLAAQNAVDVLLGFISLLKS
ncbi:hypothetical protein LguiA_019994 [Lonicera macranthoides]